MARNNPRALVEAVEAAGTSASDQVFHEHKLRRAGIDTSPAAHKAAEARATQAAEPFTRAFKQMNFDLAFATVAELRELIEEGISNGSATEEKLDALVQDLQALQDLCESGKVYVR
jgi:hypothetical protein